MDDFHCLLCSSRTLISEKINNKEYYSCSRCGAVMLHPHFYLAPEQERERYLCHNNDVNDPGYQNFVRPLADEVKRCYSKDHSGLDFGAGTGPVTTKLLRDSGYRVELYDLFFRNDPKILENRYDYIICCEVMEHFRKPSDEFRLLRSLLNRMGMLLCKTSLFTQNINFEKWYYKNDPTHIIFYTEKSLKFIKENFDFESMEITEDFIKFTV